VCIASFVRPIWIYGCHLFAVDPEPCPKWAALSEVLVEIHGKLNESKVKLEEGDNQVLVLVEEGRTCNQVRQVCISFTSLQGTFLDNRQFERCRYHFLPLLFPCSLFITL